MTVLNFPANPTDGQTYTENGVTYTWDANGTNEGFWTAAGEAINLQSVTDNGNTTTHGAEFGGGNISLNANGSGTFLGPLQGGSATDISSSPSGTTQGVIGVTSDATNGNAQGAVVGRNLVSGGRVFCGVTSEGSQATTSEIFEDGSATFAGDVTVGDEPGVGSNIGSKLSNQGFISASRATGGAVFNAYKTGDATKQIELKSDGSATFAGNVDVGDRGTNGVRISSSGILQPSRTSANVKVFEGQLNGSQTSAIDASGAAAFQRVTFGSVPGPTSDSNTLDDYEEGTWTPTVDAGAAATFTNTNQNGTYTKIGRQVTVTAEVTAEMTDGPGVNAGVQITLPFQIMTGDPGVCMIRVRNGGSMFGDQSGISNDVSVFPAQGSISTAVPDPTINVGNVNTNFYPAGVGVTLRFDFTYNTDA